MSEQRPDHPPSDKDVGATDSAAPERVPVALHSGYRRGFFFWSLAPFLVLFLVVMPICVEKDSAGRIIALSALEAVALTLLLGLWNPYRFWWAWRLLGMIVFLAYIGYVGDMVIKNRIGVGRRSEQSLPYAVIGLFAFGLPGLWYAIFGRLTWSRESTNSSDDLDDDDLDDGPPSASAAEGLR